MKNLALIHGSGGHGEVFWLPYIKAHFQALDWTVSNPNFPDGAEQTLENWLAVANEIDLNDQSVLVGHSLGCPLIMSWLQGSNVKIKKAVLVAGLYQKERFSDLNFLEEYDWKKIKQNCEEFIFVHSTNDPWKCDEQEADYAFSRVGGTKIMLDEQGHFGSGTHNQEYPEFPLLIKLIED